MSWNEGLLPQQLEAASHHGRHARLLSGPGTGKTLVLSRRIVYLINEQSCSPIDIVALTFTRAAAHELKKRIENELGQILTPRTSTLHSFALRQLLKNAHRIKTLPQPLRIADDWEERNIIIEHLKTLLNHRRISQTRELLLRLAADWESLAADEPGWAPDPRFIGNWHQHRGVFGYTLRAELTYQLKRALEQIPDFDIDGPFRYLLVDEYQDLNKCDLAVIHGIARAGVEVFAAGDDDQSIYWFRKAHPDGIRSFSESYPNARDLPLEICKRCDPNILALAEFIATLDPDRIPKSIRAENGRAGGEVQILRFANQNEEALGLAQLAQYFINDRGFSPNDILVLLRVDTRNAYSIPILQAFENLGIPATTNVQADGPLNSRFGRIIISFLRLVLNPTDDLSWYQILSLRNNHIGFETLLAIYDLCRNNGIRFNQALAIIEDDHNRLQYNGLRVQQETGDIRNLIQRFQALTQSTLNNLGDVNQHLTTILDETIGNIPERQSIEDYLNSFIREYEIQTVSHLISTLDSVSEDIEQELQQDKVNIISMHKAKGLTAPIVLIPVAEDEHIPGREQVNPGLGDERRLLYVSLTRAKHHLFISYCNCRTGQQRNLGRDSGRLNRSLTRFLRDAPVRPVDGLQFVRQRISQ